MKTLVLACVVYVLMNVGVAYATDIKSDMIERCADGRERLVVYVPEGEVVDLTEGDTTRLVEWNTNRFETLSRENNVLIVARCHVENHRYSAFPRPRLEGPTSEINEMMELEYIFRSAQKDTQESSELFHILIDVPSDTLVEYGAGPYIRQKIHEYFQDSKVGLKDYAPLYVTLDERKVRFNLFPKGFARIVDMVDEMYGAYFLRYVNATCKERVHTMEDLTQCAELDVVRFGFISGWYGADFFYVTPYTGEVPIRYQLF